MVDFLRRNVSWLAVALLVSLAGNFFFGGLAAGRFLHHDFERPRMERLGGPGQMRWILERVADRLPHDQRQAFRQAMESRRDALVAEGKQLHDAREAVQRAIEARPFDRAAYDNAVAALAERQHAFGADLADAVGDAIELAAGAPPAGASGTGSTGSSSQ